MFDICIECNNCKDKFQSSIESDNEIFISDYYETYVIPFEKCLEKFVDQCNEMKNRSSKSMNDFVDKLFKH